MSGLAGVSGSLVSSAYAAALLRGDLGSDERRAVSALRRWWRVARERCGPASSPRALTDVVAAPLAAMLGFELRRPHPITETTWMATLEAGDGCAPIVITTWAGSFDAAWRSAVRYSLAMRARWCFLANGPALRLLDAGRTFTRRHLDFQLDVIADDEAAARLLLELASAHSVVGSGTGARDAPLASVVTASDAHGQRVCTALGLGVHRALEHLLTAFAERRPGRRRARAPALDAVYEQALTAVYRLLFLCFAEARGLVPTWHPVYQDAYTVESLRNAAERADPPYGIWEAFQAMSRLAHQGCEAGDLRVTAFNGRLFAPARAPLLDGVALPEHRARDVVLALSTTAAPDGARERVSYRDLGVEELGAVYERLLDYEPALAAAPAPATHGRQPVAPIVLALSAVSRRKATGTFYTPRPITRFLARQALEPLTCGASSRGILALRVVDPAMGSGAFLVAACRYLAQCYEAALVREGHCHEGDVSPADRAGYRRLIAQRCLFGVDRNPMAVHLARLSMWLTTLAADKPLTFLDHRLVTGDSLVGASPADVSRTTPGRRRARGADARQLPLFDPSTLGDAAADARAVRDEIAQTLDDTAEIVRRKEQALAELGSAGALRAWKATADLWCAGWFTAAAPRGAFRALVDHAMTGSCELPAPVVARHWTDVERIAHARRFFHWPLEFPEVFFGPDGQEHPDAGFDAVIGNPPWEMLRADRHAGDESDPGAMLRFTRDSGLYHAQSQGHANQYQLFVERALSLVRPGGRVALVVPSGLAQDHGCAALRHLLLRQSRLESIVGFDNRRGVFPIHRSVRFLLVTAARGGETARVRCRFGLQDPGVLDALDEGQPAGAREGWISLTPALLEQVSGPGLAIPDVRSANDLAILQKAARDHAPVASERGWHLRFGRELNATDDRPHFSASGRGLPIVEGKHVTPFAVDIGASALRIDPAVAARLLGRAPAFRHPRLAFRDVASATNRTTLIAAIVPGGCVTTHTLFCLRSPLGMDDQLVLCALFNSYPANFLVRLRVSTHVTLAVVDALPVPRPRAGERLYAELLQCAQALAARPGHREAEARVHATAARAYGLTDEELAHVLLSFPLVPREHRDAVMGAFREGG